MQIKSIAIYLLLILIFFLYSCSSSVNTDSYEVSASVSENVVTENNSDLYTEIYEEISNIYTEQQTEYTETTIETTLQNNEEEFIISENSTAPDKFDKMINVIESYGDNISVFYKDMTNGEIYFYNKEASYVTASVIKAPYAVYLYQLALAGNCNLNEKLEYTKDLARFPVAIVGQEKFGTFFTIERLIEYSIRYSDNTAYNMLLNKFGYTGFKNYYESRGLNLKPGMTIGINSMTDIEYMAFYLEQIYEFIEEKNLYSETLKNYMINTELQVIKADAPVARKYGFMNTDMSEIGIVFDEERPYLLIIRTKGYYDAISDTYSIILDGKYEDYPVTFEKISRAVEEYNNSK